jgi:hypothetical protein
MADKYWFEGGFIDIQGITITPNTSVRVQALCYYSAGPIIMKFVIIEGEEYHGWGKDDNYLICLVGYRVGMGKRVQVVSNDGSLPPQDIGNYDFGLNHGST